MGGVGVFLAIYGGRSLYVWCEELFTTGPPIRTFWVNPHPLPFQFVVLRMLQTLYLPRETRKAAWASKRWVP